MSIVLPEPGQSKTELIDGPAGAIEILLQAPRAPAAAGGYAVICHPHPLMGGALSNKVTYTLANCAQKAGLYALRFNFRGVGRSAGAHGYLSVTQSIETHYELIRQILQSYGILMTRREVREGLERLLHTESTDAPDDVLLRDVPKRNLHVA